MDLANWAFNAIDRIFSTMRSGEGGPTCPRGTDPVGYVSYSWGTWRPLCLTALSVEDVEDTYIFGFLVTGSLLIGLGGYLFYQQIKKLWVAVQPLVGLLNRTDGLSRSVQTQNQYLLDLSRKLDGLMRMDESIPHEGWGTAWLQGLTERQQRSLALLFVRSELPQPSIFIYYSQEKRKQQQQGVHLEMEGKEVGVGLRG